MLNFQVGGKFQKTKQEIDLTSVLVNYHFSLTIADTILIIDIMWQKSVVQHFLSLAEPEWYEQTYPIIWHPLKGISLSGTIFMTLAVSTERFRSVCSPMKLKIVSI